jgi:hypothetical protein
MTDFGEVLRAVRLRANRGISEVAERLGGADPRVSHDPITQMFKLERQAHWPDQWLVDELARALDVLPAVLTARGWEFLLSTDLALQTAHQMCLPTEAGSLVLSERLERELERLAGQVITDVAGRWTTFLEIRIWPSACQMEPSAVIEQASKWIGTTRTATALELLAGLASAIDARHAELET